VARDRLARMSMRPSAISIAALFVLAACSNDTSTPPSGDASQGSPDPNTTSDASGLSDASQDGASPLTDAASHDADAVANTGDGGTTDAKSDAGYDAGSDAGGDATAPEAKLRSFVYVGGFDYSGSSYPFRTYSLNRATYALTPVGGVSDMGQNPSYICPSTDGKHLYIANEVPGASGGVTVANVDSATGMLTKGNHQPPIDQGFVFTSLDPAGKYVLAASYAGGNVASYPINSDGSIGARAGMLSFGTQNDDTWSHSIRVHPSGKWAYVPNKKVDSVAELGFNAATGALSNLAGSPFATFKGPRHIAFNGDGSRAFVVYENSDEIASLSVDASGGLVLIDHKPRLPTGAPDSDTGAHVLVHPNGKFVYVSNRGSDTIAAFGVDAAGKLTLIEHESSRGNVPRNFDIDSSGKILVVANQGQNDGRTAGALTVYAIETDGSLTPKGSPLTGLKATAAVSIVTFQDP
jgi:6-phosphogluconolactonase